MKQAAVCSFSAGLFRGDRVCRINVLEHHHVWRKCSVSWRVVDLAGLDSSWHLRVSRDGRAPNRSRHPPCFQNLNGTWRARESAATRRWQPPGLVQPEPSYMAYWSLVFTAGLVLLLNSVINNSRHLKWLCVMWLPGLSVMLGSHSVLNSQTFGGDYIWFKTSFLLIYCCPHKVFYSRLKPTPWFLKMEINATRELIKYNYWCNKLSLTS